MLHYTNYSEGTYVPVIDTKMTQEQIRCAFLVCLAVAFSIANVDAAIRMQTPLRLSLNYYKRNTTCTYAEEFIKHQVKLLWNIDRSLTPKLLRLLYSDCFVTGCDASILLDGPKSERYAPQNIGLGGFVAIDKIKKVLEIRCPGVVSCADILNLATRNAVHLAGGPSYPVYTGRRDGMTSRADTVDLASPSITADEGLAYFESRGLDVLDMGTLMGAHSLGSTHCSRIVDRLYNYKNTGKPDPSMDAEFADKMRKVCPPRTKKGQSDPLVPLNPESDSSYNLSSSYYKRAISHKAVLGIDQQLVYGNDTSQIAEEFANGFEDFRRSLALSMNRLGNIDVLTGTDGEIRLMCSKTNKA